jgi:hypothetical protein
LRWKADSGRALSSRSTFPGKNILIIWQSQRVETASGEYCFPGPEKDTPVQPILPVAGFGAGKSNRLIRVSGQSYLCNRR